MAIEDFTDVVTPGQTIVTEDHVENQTESWNPKRKIVEGDVLEYVYILNGETIKHRRYTAGSDDLLEPNTVRRFAARNSIVYSIEPGA